VDTGAYIALADADDRHHAAAAALVRELGAGLARVTTWGVVSEAYTWMRYHLSGPHAQRWLQVLQASASNGTTQIIYPDADLDAACQRQLQRLSDQKLSYVDGLSLAVLQTTPNIDAVFGFDGHMALGGVAVIPAIP